MARKNKNKANQKPRARLINKLTLVVLTATSLWALWLVAPTKSMLIQLIARSSSPEVSLAFLQQLYASDPQNRDIVKQLVANYRAMGDLEHASELIESILYNSDGERDWAALKTYLNLLLEQSYTDDPIKKQQATEQILALLAQIDYIPDPELARIYANTAIAFSQPLKGMDLLSPHIHSGQTSYQELINLALQSEDYTASLKYQLDAFREFDNIEQATALFDMLIATAQPELSRNIILAYHGKLHDDPSFLQASIDHSRRIGNWDVTLIQSERLLAIAPSIDRYARAAQDAMSIGNISAAALFLQKAIAIEPRTSEYVLLHDIYRWQGDVDKALAISIKLLARQPTEKQIRDGIDESRALGDIYHEGIFYNQLALSNLIQPAEYNAWMNAIEKAEGTDKALASIKRLANMRPRDSALISHIARLYSYLDNHSAVARQWQKLRPLRRPTLNEAERFANAYIMLNEPKLALNTLTAPNDWIDADEDYLEAVSSLAWETGNRPLSEQSQNQLATLASDNLDTYRYINLLSPLDDSGVEKLTKLYQKTGNTELLLAAMRASTKPEYKDRLISLLLLAKEHPELDEHLEILGFRAQLALLDNKDPQAEALFNQILKIDPSNASAVSNLIWLALKHNDKDSLARLYDSYKAPLSGNSDLWLAFASASQQLGRGHEASTWYEKVLQQESNDPAIILNYASLLEQQGQAEKAYQLRRYVLTQQAKTLLTLPGGDTSYRSLIALFVDDKTAKAMSTSATLAAPSDSRIAEWFGYLLADNQAEQLLFWQQQTALRQYQLPDWQRLSLALQQKDKHKVEAILSQSLNLPEADENVALQFTGRHQEAWQQGQELIGTMADKTAENQLRRVHVLQHPNKTHSVRAQRADITQWDITRYSLDYYRPHYDGYWRLGTDWQQADTPDLIRGTDIDDEYRLRGKYHYQLSEGFWNIGIDLANGVGDQRLGFNAAYQTALDDYWQAGIEFGLNNHIEASQLLAIAGQDTRLGFNATYQPTAREALTMQLNYHWLSTRFGDDIGHGFDINIRATERLFFADPEWQLYADATLQNITHDDAPLSGFNQWQQGPQPLTSQDFIESKYQRVAIGQRVSHGEPGQPGATVPSPRYWFDSSLGYNIINSRADVTLSAGLGWRIVGNDELYITTDWQSQDRNGEESLRFSVGYYYSF
ncbi:hypothetical protein ABT56_11730 [Photobacterium aquae]|uniref:PelB C-terminal domain-containing protein n=1 Tax=Photobacterium aquae TaxID=1195763 RepID=A0A0J1JSZ1_9GAMM|nr:tetratricopeptide repeat protein [Photobacterium aquae]KLV05382.1 hypothetical protein ABT56_11730 [Photobacterium aquae]